MDWMAPGFFKRGLWQSERGTQFWKRVIYRLLAVEVPCNFFRAILCTVFLINYSDGDFEVNFGIPTVYDVFMFYSEV